LPNFKQRLVSELEKIFPSMKESIYVENMENMEKDKYLAYSGAMLLAEDLSESMWISREEYEEIGSEIVHRKCY